MNLSEQEPQPSQTEYRIQLSRGYSTVVDAADYPALSRFKWSALVTKKKNGRLKVYAIRMVPADGVMANGRKKAKCILMHRQIIGNNSDLGTDHKDGDSLNNRRYNLRSATDGQNNANMPKRLIKKATSKFKGVSRLPGGNWRSIIRDGSKTRHLGVFDSEENAARRYDSEASKLFGEFARLNFPVVKNA